MIADLLIRFCKAISHGQPRVICGRNVDDPYLTRYYLTPRAHDNEGMDRHTNAPLFALYLHRFHRGDDDTALHNHPWKWSVSLILKNGYSEERRVGNRRVLRRQVKPWTFNVLKANTFHRVDLIDGECWSLFFAGPITQSWGFWDRFSGVYTDWKKFLGVSN